MSRQRKDSWPVWKIALTTLLWTAAGAGLMWANLYLLPNSSAPATGPASPLPPGTPAPDGRTAPEFSAAHLLLLFCLICWAMAVVFAGWVVYKLYMRIPAWRRRQLFGRVK